jgi:hypothetical protein
MTDLMTPVAIAAYPVVKKALDGLAPTIRRGAGAIAKNLIDKAIANFQIGFAPYLHTSYERCRSVKTLLSQDRPLALLDIYVHLLLDCKDHHVTDDGLIEDLATYRRVVITGLAGCGKSMFMKYLTICRFENPRGMIPLFVELRQLNSLTSKNLLSYIHQSCASGSKSVTYDQFELALRAGGLLLILDGFDEIDFAHRDAISEQILNVSINYPQVPVVLSSRPDEKFASWQDFYTFTIGALSKVQVLELIDKINYDEELKGSNVRWTGIYMKLTKASCLPPYCPLLCFLHTSSLPKSQIRYTFFMSKPSQHCLGVMMHRSPSSSGRHMQISP